MLISELHLFLRSLERGGGREATVGRENKHCIPQKKGVGCSSWNSVSLEEEGGGGRRGGPVLIRITIA